MAIILRLESQAKKGRKIKIVFREIGFQAQLFQGGYKEYRKAVRSAVQDVESHNRIDDYKFILVSGVTGCGKSLLLETLEKRGEQVWS